MAKIGRKGPLNLMEPPYTIVGGEYAMAFPPARLTEAGRSAQRARPGIEYESDYSNPTFDITIQVFPATQDAIDDLINEFCSPSPLILGTDTSSGSAQLVNVDVGDYVDADDGAVLIPFTGTRRPGWGGATWPLAVTIAGGVGMEACPEVGGTLAARVDNLRAISAADAKNIALGIAHEPATGYDPFDGTGSWGSNVPLTATEAELWAGADVEVAPNRGSHLGVATLKHTSIVTDAVKYRLGNEILTASDPDHLVASGVTNATETLCIGKVSIPAAPLPERSGGAVYGAEVTGASNIVGSTYLNTTYPTVTRYGETFAHAGGLQTGVAFWIQGDPYNSTRMVAYIEGPNGEYAGTTVDVAAAYDGAVRFLWEGVPIPAGTVKATLQGEAAVETGWRVRKAGAYAGGAGFTMGYPSMVETAITDDLYFIAYRRPEVSFDARTPITAICSEASKTGAFLRLTRIPADYGAFVAHGVFLAGSGVTYNYATDAFYPADSAGPTGTSIQPRRSGQIALPPGQNSIVADSDGGDLVVTADVTELRKTMG